MAGEEAEPPPVDSTEGAAQVRSDFLADMSHEIHAPLNAVLSMSGRLLDEPLGSEQRELVDAIHGSGEALRGLLNDVLDLSKIEAGMIELEEAPFSPRRLFRDVLQLMEGRAHEKGLALRREIDVGLPRFLVGDEARLRQVLLNLLSHAIELTSGGSVELRVGCHRTSDDAVGLLIRVADTGIGIPAPSSDAISFARTEARPDRSFGGSGLGLAISRQLVGLMEGSLRAESCHREGASFTLELVLPVCAAPLEGVGDEAPSPRLHARVLVVEDERLNQMVLRRMLEALGCEVDVAGDGAAGLELARGGEYDLVLMDWTLPVLDGLETTERIRALPGPEAQVPIIAMTAKAMAGEQARCLEAGMNDSVGKPIRRERLIDVMSRWLGDRKPDDTTT